MTNNYNIINYDYKKINEALNTAADAVCYDDMDTLIWIQINHDYIYTRSFLHIENDGILIKKNNNYELIDDCNLKTDEDYLIIDEIFYKPKIDFIEIQPQYILSDFAYNDTNCVGNKMEIATEGDNRFRILFSFESFKSKLYEILNCNYFNSDIFITGKLNEYSLDFFDDIG